MPEARAIEWRLRDDTASSNYAVVAMFVVAIALGVFVLVNALPGDGAEVVRAFAVTSPFTFGLLFFGRRHVRAAMLRKVRRDSETEHDPSTLPFVGLVGSASFGQRDSMSHTFSVGGGRGPDGCAVVVTEDSIAVTSARRDFVLSWGDVVRIDGGIDFLRTGTLALRTSADQELTLVTQDYPSLLRAIRLATGAGEQQRPGSSGAGPS